MTSDRPVIFSGYSDVYHTTNITYHHDIPEILIQVPLNIKILMKLNPLGSISRITSPRMSNGQPCCNANIFFISISSKIQYLMAYLFHINILSVPHEAKK